jgi:hypothetical protein
MASLSDNNVAAKFLALKLHDYNYKLEVTKSASDALNKLQLLPQHY